MRFSIIFAWIIFLLSAFPVFAVEIPDFPACAAVDGELIADYSEGVHGIVGSTQVYVGSDKVYQVGEGAVTQCFCASDGRGIQTNWWQANNLTDQDISLLSSSGWQYIPTGLVWGLTDDPYLAQNISFSCLATNPSSTPSPSSGGSSGGEVQGEGTGGGEILGLAATGDSLKVIGLILAAFALIAYATRGLSRSRHEK